MLFQIQYTTLVCDECCKPSEDAMSLVGVGLLFCRNCAPEIVMHIQEREFLWRYIGGRMSEQISFYPD